MTQSTTTLEPTEAFVGHIERETRQFLDVAGRSPLAATVPTYPAFTVETLTAHVGRALRIFHDIVSTGSYSEDEPVPAPDGEAVLEWTEAALDPLLSLLTVTPPDTLVPLPHQQGERPVSFVASSLAVEVGVHRWDVESALGEHAPIPAELAATEIDKVFEVYVPRLAGQGVPPLGGTLALVATDTDIQWHASVEDGGLRAGRTDGRVAGEGSVDADVVVRATTEDLALLVWKRWLAPRSGLEVTGSSQVLDAFSAIDYIPDPRTTPAH
jgi:uncharacterized protein (TIGR03083 family)